MLHKHLVDLQLVLKQNLEPLKIFANVELNRRDVGLADKLKLRLHEVRGLFVPVNNSDVSEMDIVMRLGNLKLNEAVNCAEDDLRTQRHREPKYARRDGWDRD